MCFFNIRKYDNCAAETIHTYKEVHKCDLAKARDQKTCCPEGEWVNLEGIAELDNIILCPVCTGVIIEHTALKGRKRTEKLENSE